MSSHNFVVATIGSSAFEGARATEDIEVQLQMSWQRHLTTLWWRHEVKTKTTVLHLRERVQQRGYEVQLCRGNFIIRPTL